MATNIGKWASLILLGFFLGSIYEKQAMLAVVDEATKRVTYTDVHVEKKLSEDRFIVQPARMAPLDVSICPVSTVDWKPGENLRDWTFEQLPGCKRVVSYHKGES